MKPRYFVGIIILSLVIASVFLFQKKLGAPQKTAVLDAKSKGVVGATVEIIEFSDFQCPACKKALPLVEEIMKDYPGQIKISFRHFPLPSHEHAYISHQAGQCAAEQNKFWPFHDMLYENQTIWSSMKNPVPNFLRYAKQLELDFEAFGTCLSDETIHQKVLKERDEGNALKVRSTPTFFIGEKRFSGHRELSEQGLPYLEELLKK